MTTDMERQMMLRDVWAQADHLRGYERALVDATTTARAHGFSWRQIADQVGKSRQAVQQWYSRRVSAP